jgi:pyruvate/2-oxoglutarate dehydrogenase complex dihydrolipoamide acyltransferase (E2) component
MDQLLKEPVLVHLPKENNNDESAKLLAWRVPAGASVIAGQALAEFETSKTTFELHAPVAGKVQYRWKEGDEIAVGSFVCLISEDGRAAFPEDPDRKDKDTRLTPPLVAAKLQVKLPANSVASNSVASSEPAPQGLRLSARARELLSKHGLDPAQFAKRGLMRAQDVMAGLLPQSQAAVPTEAKRAGDGQDGLRTSAAGAPYRSEKIPRSKRMEIAFLRSGAERALPSAVTLACPTCGLRAAAEQAGMNVSGVLVYEVGRLLRKYPAFNGFFAEDQMHFYQEVNIGFAFDAGRGLKVPVVRRADERGLEELDRELQELMVQYLNDELAVEALADGTFTITDLAQEGTTFFSPLINQRQSAILGVGAEFFAPGQRQGWFHLTLAFDHQLSNGREAAQFLADLNRRLAAYEKAWDAALREEPYCSHCERTLSALQEIKAHLVEEVQPDGAKSRVCSLCLRGL